MTFNEVVTQAVSDIAEHGFDPARVAYWQERLKQAAEQAMGASSKADEMLREAMRSVYERLVERGGAIKHHPGVSRFTVERLKPKLRAELDRRVFASADLIKLNRQQSVAKMLQRFSGWASSIPEGGSEVVDKVDVKTDIRKALTQLPYEERRVLIDQGHKFAASLNSVIAVDGGAIAGIWKSHWRQAGYNYRCTHKARDGHFYLIRGNWASEKGFVKRGPAGYTDEITQPAEEPFCRCAYQYVYALRDLPDDMVTVAAKEELARVRAEIAAKRRAA